MEKLVRATRYIALNLLITCMGFAALANSKSGGVQIYDPFMVIYFDPNLVKFEELSKEEVSKLLIPRGRHWIFARYCPSAGKGKCYVVETGYAPVPLDTEPGSYGEPEPTFGSVYSVENGKYTSIGPMPVLEYREQDLPPEIIDGILDDGVRRLIKAFGGKENLQKKIDEEPHRYWMLRSMIEALKRAGLNASR